MKCPSCGAAVEAGAVICSKCDFVLDPSFFGGSVDEGATADERTDTPPETPAVAAPAPAARAARPRPALSAEDAAILSKPAAKPAPPPPRPPAPAPVSRTAPTAILDPPPAKAELEPVSTKELHADAQLEQLWRDFVQFAKKLDLPDRLGFFAAAAQVLFLLLPWQTRARDGDVPGVVTAGFLVLLGAGAAAGAVVVRRRGVRQWDPLWIWLVQLGGAAFMILWCLICIHLAWDTRTVAGITALDEPISKPAMGAYIALLSSAVSLGGGLWGLKNKLR